MSQYQEIILYPAKEGHFFLSLTKAAFEKNNYRILKPKDCFQLTRLWRRDRTIAVLNWLEDSPYEYGLSAWQIKTRFLKSLVLILLSLLFCKRIVWVKHNYRAHNRHVSSTYFNALCALLKKVSTKMVYLEEYPVQSKSEICIKHPAYLLSGEQKQRLQEDPTGQARDIVFGVYGYIKEYKNLHKLLQKWPSTLALTIKGECADPKYQMQLQKIVKQRKLNADISYTSLSDEQFNGYLSRTKFVLVPHAKASMYCAGSFYHSIAFGCNIIAEPSAFGLHKNKEHQFVSLLSEELSDFALIESRYVMPEQVMQVAERDYNINEIARQWKSLIENL